MLQHEWNKASNRHGVLSHDVRRPTLDEKSELRTTIRICKAFGTHFDIGIDFLDKDAIAPMSMILLAVELDDVSLLDQLVSEGHPADGLPNYFGMSTLAFPRTSKRKVRSIGH